jgi:glycosyltransferase involved in cell wall biosynthesis
VLFVHDHLGYPGGAIHGVTTYFRSVLPGFDTTEVENLLCINTYPHPGAALLEAAGVRSMFFLGRSKWDPRVLWDLVLLIRKQRIDVLHLTGMKGMFLGRIAARLTGRPAIIHFHDADRAWLHLLQRRLARWTDWAVAVCEPVRRTVIRDFALPPEKVEVLHNGICAEPFENVDRNARGRVRAGLGIVENAAVIGVFGRLFPEKGQQVLVRAFPKILARRPDARLLIVGDGPTRTDCELLSATLNISHAVRFTGHRQDIAELLAAVDTVALPSLWEEPLPYAALEALCAGRPVVAFSVGGIPEIVIDGETGLLVPKGDIDALADALLRVLDDRALRDHLIERGRQHAKRFTVQRHVQRLTEIYRMVARKQPCVQRYNSPAAV